MNRSIPWRPREALATSVRSAIWLSAVPRYDFVRQALRVLPWTVAIAMIAYRYANLPLATFINDEPIFVAAARDQLHTGHIATFSPLQGNQGVHYGPVVLWFYGLVHLVFGADPATHIVAMLTLLSAAHVALACGIGSRFGSLAGATMLAFIASSPYQFFWSRQAWDPMVNVCSAFICFAFCRYDRITVGVAAFLGIASSLAFSTHLISTPLVVLVFAVLAWDAVRNRTWKPLAVAGGSALLLSLPYLVYIAHHYEEMTKAEDLSWDLVQSYAVAPAQIATIDKIDYYFDGAWPDFLAWSEHWRDSPLLFTNLHVVIAFLAGSGLARGAVHRDPTTRRVARLAIATWVAYVAFLSRRHIPESPHYQYSVWWVVPLGLASLLAGLRKVSRPVALGAFGCLWGLAFAQMGFIVDWMSYVRAHVGTQYIHYGTPIGAQKSALRDVCTGAEWTHLFVRNETRVFDHSLRYVASTEPACSGKTIAFCGGLGNWDCSHAPGEVRARLTYARPRSGELAFHFE